jgi:hypothetical protein
MPPTRLTLRRVAAPPTIGLCPQHFGFEVNHITDWQTFIGLGLGTEVAALVILLVIFKRLGWA